MEWFSPEFWTALISIVIIDLVLAGDNAVVIGLAARKLPKHLQMKAILWGTAGAIVIRAVAAAVVVWLLKIPGLLIIGGIVLIWIAYKLLSDDNDHAKHVTATSSIWTAIRTIIIADAVMGIDNVLAIAGASNGSILLVIIGLVISVPIIIWGSTLIIKWIERYPFIIYIGAGVLAFTAGKMITDELFLQPLFAHSIVRWGFIGIVVAGLLIVGRSKKEIEA